MAVGWKNKSQPLPDGSITAGIDGGEDAPGFRPQAACPPGFLTLSHS